jgi:hypothetical protein
MEMAERWFAVLETKQMPVKLHDHLTLKMNLLRFK